MATKAELVNLVQKNLCKDDPDSGPKDAERAISAVFDAVGKAVVDSGGVTIRGFGKFSVSERSARVGRNPRTGEAVDIPASKAVRFKAAAGLKEKVNS